MTSQHEGFSFLLVGIGVQMVDKGHPCGCYRGRFGGGRVLEGMVVVSDPVGLMDGGIGNI